MATQTRHEHAPDYGLEVWGYERAPAEYRALFGLPEIDYEAYIVWERRHVESWGLAWITPDGTWWNLWNISQEHELGDDTKIYLLVEKVKS